LEMCGIAALPFAVGVYLPFSSSAPIFVGGLVRYFVEKLSKPQSEAEAESSAGVLFSSGLIAGGSICGLLLAAVAAFELNSKIDLSGYMGSLANPEYPIAHMFAISMFAGISIILFVVGKRGMK
ncbi:MAG: OPT/YSL family transporter, partial [Blastocatellia bacterium]|nr:OPT/YSL family transporter [Blastocatellia bacterium]